MEIVCSSLTFVHAAGLVRFSGVIIVRDITIHAECIWWIALLSKLSVGAYYPVLNGAGPRANIRLITVLDVSRCGYTRNKGAWYRWYSEQVIQWGRYTNDLTCPIRTLRSMAQFLCTVSKHAFVATQLRGLSAVT